MSSHISVLRAALLKEKLDGFILPVNDEFMGEYVPDCAKRLTWLTGFTGSAGMAAVLEDKAAFFTDGRYTLQAQTEVQGFELHNSGDMAPDKWIAKHAPENAVIGYDPKLHTLQSLKRYEREAKSVTWKAVAVNPVDALWQDRPKPPQSPVRVHQLEYAGEASADKRTRIAKDVAALGADAAILTAPDSLCWLLNIRGNDVPFTPFILCYGILETSGTVILYLDSARVSAEAKSHLGVDVTLKPLAALGADLKARGKLRILYDPASSPAWFYQQLTSAGARVIEGSDPCLLPKACKNAVELEGMSRAHIRDGLAVTRFLHWLDKAVGTGQLLSEMEVAAKLESFRKESDTYLEPSFTTIPGSGPNGAIVHYRATEVSNRKLDSDSLMLLDSGGQYADGTTDITRTVALGTPSAEMKDRFTRVLKGHIALARAVFPGGTSGSQLDALARQYLWQANLDYDHGTGHGVGSYLSVHEGPQRISKRAGDTALVAGMVVSNEPGYYKAGEYGIRIESLVAVKDIRTSEGKKYLGFETLTLAPIDMRVVDKTLLSEEEMQWLRTYHQRVYDTHAPHLSEEEKQWLARAI